MLAQTDIHCYSMDVNIIVDFIQRFIKVCVGAQQTLLIVHTLCLFVIGHDQLVAEVLVRFLFVVFNILKTYRSLGDNGMQQSNVDDKAKLSRFPYTTFSRLCQSLFLLFAWLSGILTISRRSLWISQYHRIFISHTLRTARGEWPFIVQWGLWVAHSGFKG